MDSKGRPSVNDYLSPSVFAEPVTHRDAGVALLNIYQRELKKGVRVPSDGGSRIDVRVLLWQDSKGMWTCRLATPEQQSGPLHAGVMLITVRMDP